MAELVNILDLVPRGALPRGPALGQLGLWAVDRQDRELAEQTYHQLVAHTGQHHWVLMDRVLGCLAAFLQEFESAGPYFDQAERVARRGGILPELALTRAAQGRLLRKHGAPGGIDAAKSLLLDARARFSELSMRHAEHQLVVELARLDKVPASTPYGTLSPRELEVLRLIAAGKTNREIAGVLVLSERTVNNHVTHFLTKTNTSTRAAASAYALRHGLI